MITIISGSIREGNTLRIAKKLKSILEINYNKASKICSLSNLNNIIPCDACDSCWENGGVCHIQDDLTEIVNTMEKATTIVVITPVYFQNISSHLKILNDRTNCLAAKESLKNKMGFAFSNGSMRNGGQEYAISALINFFLAHKMIVASGTGGENKVGFKACSHNPGDLAGIDNDDQCSSAIENLAARISELDFKIGD